MRSSLMLAAAFLLSACAGHIETRLSSAGEGLERGHSYRFAETKPEMAAEYGEVRNLLIAALAQRGFSRSEAAGVMLEIALSDRPAELALTRGEGEETSVIAPSKERKPLQSCDDREYRLSIRFTRISDGAHLYLGEAAEYHCRASLSEALPAMVNAIVSDMDGPRGTKVVERRGRE